MTVTHNGRTLKAGTDYQVSYGENTQVGKATVTIRGAGKNYSGSRTISFDITNPRNAWRTVGGKTYYYGADGQPVKWEQKIGGHWYYFNGSGVMQTGWVTWSKLGTKSYFDADGRARTGWHTIGGKRYYFDPATARSVRWENRIGGSWYYFNAASEMQTGWVTWSKLGTKSYFNDDGKARTGWHTLWGKRYYFDPATARSLRWENRIGGSWYYFNSASEMQTGWVTWSKLGTKSYFNDDGKARTGWHTLWGKRYYFDPATARSLRWENRIGGSFYYFNAASQMHTGWLTWSADKKRSYFDVNGKALTGWQTIGGQRYYFDPATYKTDGAVAQSVTGSKAVVYWVVDGEVYHTTKDCVSLKRSTNIKSGTVAQSGKKRVCKNCG